MLWWVSYILVYGEIRLGKKCIIIKLHLLHSFCLTISCILICWLTIFVNQGTCIFNPLILFFFYWGREGLEVFHWRFIFRKVKVALYTKTVILKEAETEIQEVIFAGVEHVLGLGNTLEHTPVSDLKWFRNVTRWPKVSIPEISVPHVVFCIVQQKAYNWEHLGDRSKLLTYGKILSFWFSLLNLLNSRSHGKLLKFCLCYSSLKSLIL